MHPAALGWSQPQTQGTCFWKTGQAEREMAWGEGWWALLGQEPVTSKRRMKKEAGPGQDSRRWLGWGGLLRGAWLSPGWGGDAESSFSDKDLGPAASEQLEGPTRLETAPQPHSHISAQKSACVRGHHTGWTESRNSKNSCSCTTRRSPARCAVELDLGLHSVTSAISLRPGFPLCVSVKCSFWKLSALLWHS